MPFVVLPTMNESYVERLYLNERYADVHFIFGKGENALKLPANKAILAVQSPVFRERFFGSKKKTIINISNARADDFTRFLGLFYHREVYIPDDRMAAVRRLAVEYGILDEFEHSCGLSFYNEINFIWQLISVLLVLIFGVIIKHCCPLLFLIFLFVFAIYTLSFIEVGSKCLISKIVTIPEQFYSRESTFLREFVNIVHIFFKH